MKVAIITVAGISSRFNKNIPNKDKVLKCIFHEENPKFSLLYQMIKKLGKYDKIIIVGGYKYPKLENYIEENISNDMKNNISLILNNHYEDLSSGYSLYLGIDEALKDSKNISEILFIEGDLDIDDESFLDIINADANVLTFNHEAIYSNRSVVLYQNENDDYKYLFNSDHGLLKILDPFKAIFNSGQVWKFKDMELLKLANDNFKENLIEGTNLGIIQKYFDLVDNDKIEIIGLNHWVNCNTRKDYKYIKDYWSEKYEINK